MKKLLAVLGLMGMVGADVAGAQSWDAEDGKLTLVGCYGKQDGVYCDFSFILTNKQTGTYRWYNNWFKIFKQDGTSQTANKVTFIDNQYEPGSSASHEIIANVPVKLQIYFNIPNNITYLRAIVYDNQKFDNIPVRPYGAAASAPKSNNLPFATSFGLGNYKSSLSNCQQQGAAYVCTATLTHK